ncbi:shootin-1-like [Python bivittatus]|uniref:Shootin-1-like n=1 Tax=Python bivittatus TaxID=176946 RepID=A0A9F5J079_PYTBI|nr:shootin-1-like [Python bivittatus]
MEPPEADLTPRGVIWESESNSSSEEDADGQETQIFQEMAETKEKIAEIEQASQALLAELSAMEVEYEIEKKCRERAEAFAIQVSRENVKLKQISGAQMPGLGLPWGDFASGGSAEKDAQESALDPMGQCLQQIKDLQLKVSWLLEEKKELAAQVKDLQSHVEKLQDQLEEERAEKQSLRVLKEHNQKILKRVKQASRLVTEEYGKMSLQLDLEEKLRQQAETFAHQMLVKQKEANQQSLILMQSVGVDGQLLLALEEVAKVTGQLEKAKLEHEAKVKDLEAQLVERPPPEELAKLQAALTTAEEGKACLEEQLLRAEEKCAALEQKGQRFSMQALPRSLKPVAGGWSRPGSCLEGTIGFHLITIWSLASGTVGRSKNPLPPPTSPAKMDPLMALRERKGTQRPKKGDLCSDDATARAVEEMMVRIKSGVVLRPVRREAGSLSQPSSAAASKRRSTAMELQGLLSATRRPGCRSSRRKGSQKKLQVDNQLELLLQRRRQIVDRPAQTPALPEPSAPAADQRLLAYGPRAREGDHAASATRS